MAYCKSSDVRLLIRTDLEDDEIEDLIALGDSDLDDLLGGASMTATQKKKCSMRLAAAAIADREPASFSMGKVRIDNYDRAQRWRKYVNRQVARAVGRWHYVDPLED